jgi:hypothetical protein
MRIGVLVNLDDGSVTFFKNGLEHGTGYPAGSVTGPVVHAVALGHGASATLRPCEGMRPGEYDDRPPSGTD